MNKINFTNLPDQTTPINATNMNLLQTNVETAILEDNTLAKYQGGTGIDPNTTTEPLILSSHSNVPKSGIYYYIKTVFYESVSTNANRSQIAIGYNNNEVWQRYYYSGNWSSWKELSAITEGIWTPSISTQEGANPTMTYQNRRGYYKKIGNMVFISFYLRGKITALTGTNNFGIVTGIPFSTKSIALGENSLSLGSLYSLLEDTTNVKLNPYGSVLRLQNFYGASAAKLKVTNTPYFELAGSGWYEIA